MKFEQALKLSFRQLVQLSNDAVRDGRMTTNQQTSLILKYCRANYKLPAKAIKTAVDLEGVNYGYKD